MVKATVNNKNFYRGKRVFVTGHTGFKGAWLTAVLHYLGAETMGYSLEPAEGCLYQRIDGDELIESTIGDLGDYECLKTAVTSFQPEFVFHLAAFGFVSECYADPVRAYATNVMGSVNLLNVLRDCESVKSIVLVSTDKVYANNGSGTLFKEADPLGGLDPYSGSKTAMECMAADFRESYFLKKDISVGLSTARASNVLGGGDHIKTRLIPSILDSVAAGKPVELRNPDQTRPWQSVLDALNGYLTLGRLMYENPLNYSGAWNIGPGPAGVKTVAWVYDRIKNSFHGLESRSGEKFGVKEAAALGMEISKMLEETDWAPQLTTEQVVFNVVDFFKRQRSGENERVICMDQIGKFFEED